MADEIETPGDLPNVSQSAFDKAQKEGVLQGYRDIAADQLTAPVGLPGDDEAAAEAQRKRMPADVNTTPLEPFLLLGVDELADVVDPKADRPLDENSVKGILALERNGKNRTPYVQLLCKRLGVKSPTEVYHGGPPYTNDVSNVTKI